MRGGYVMSAENSFVSLTSSGLTARIETRTGRWSLLDVRSGLSWPSDGLASPGKSEALSDGFLSYEIERDPEGNPRRISLSGTNGIRLNFALVAGGQALEISFAGDAIGDVSVFEDALEISDKDKGCLLIPCREGLLIRSDNGCSFKRSFGTSDYEGCHMNMLGLVKRGSALLLDWDDAYVFPELESVLSSCPGEPGQRLITAIKLCRSARTIRLTPLGPGSWNTVAREYRRIAEKKHLAVTLREKTRRDPHLGLLPGAANVKLWTCLARRMNEDSTAEESVTVRWTFAEAARIAEHLYNDLDIRNCLFILGGWTEGGYDCRHPDNLPANPECGGNDTLRDAIERIQALGYVAALHDNYQDMYADAESWDPSFIEKDPEGNIKKGGRWLGGRAYMVCAPKQLELAQRPQNLPEIEKLFGPWCYFIDTTYAVGPRECHDPNHPLDRNDDIAWKSRLSDYARDIFGLFGSECGREWALPHSDWFEGLVGVSGRCFHGLEPEKLGAEVIPFWEMVYHDCQVCHGKYGYAAGQAAAYVLHHALCARTLNYHSIPDHLYWQAMSTADRPLCWCPAAVCMEPAGTDAFVLTCEWDIRETTATDWNVSVQLADGANVLLQNEYMPKPSASSWQAGQRVRLGPYRITVPAGLTAERVTVYAGFFDPAVPGRRLALTDTDKERRIRLGILELQPQPHVAAGQPELDLSAACFTRSDHGWADGFHPMDVFIKNTHEVLGPLNALTTDMRLTDFRFLNDERTLKQAIYGEGSDRATVTVNMGREDREVLSDIGGTVILPRWGLLVEAPQFTAFHARRWGNREYPEGAFFTIRPDDGLPLVESRRIRVFHAFGAPGLTWSGKEFSVKREEFITLD